MGQCLAKGAGNESANPQTQGDQEQKTTPPEPAGPEPSCSAEAVKPAVSPPKKPSGPSVMQQIRSIMGSLSRLPQDGCRSTMQAAAAALQTHIPAADTVCIYSCPGNVNGVVFVAGVGPGADMIQQQHAVMLDSAWSPVACINQQPITSSSGLVSGCPPLSASISSCDEASLQGLPQDWQLLAAAGMRSFMTLELTGGNGNPVGVIGLASRQEAGAFDGAQCFDTMLETACAGLASNTMLGHTLLLGACELVAGLHADKAAGFNAMAINMLQGVQQLLLSVANMEVGVRIGILDRQTEVVVVLSRRQPRRRSIASCEGSTSSVQADWVLHMARIPAAGSLLLDTLAGSSPSFIADTTAAAARAAPDLFLTPDEVVQSLVLVPCDAPNAAARCQAGLYITSAQPSNFGPVKPAIISIVGLLRPLLRDVLLQNDAVAAMQREAVQAAPETPSPRPSIDSVASDTTSKALPWTANMVQLLQQQVRDVASKASPSRDGDAFVQDLKLAKALGAGAFGRVYLGTYRGCQAAIKVMHVPSTQRRIMKNALEIAVQESMRHPNIVPVFGVLADMIEDMGAGISLEGAFPSTNCALLRYRPLQPSDPPNAITCNLVAMEFCEKGTLRQAFRAGILHSIVAVGPQPGLPAMVVPDMPKLLHVLLELASALEYLHERGFFHCDVKPENVMLRSSSSWPGWTCKLCDFGLVKMLGEDRLYMRNKSTSGTLTYIAPERFEPGTKLMPAVDIYALGVMMYELYTRRSAFPPGTLPAHFVSRVAAGERPQFPAGTPSRYARLATACWAQDAAERPSAAAVAVELKEMMALVSRLSRG